MAMSKEHKAELAKGREEARAVKDYLGALEAHRPRRGRQRTVATVTKQLDAVDKKLVDAAPLQRLLLTQDRMDLQAELERLRSVVNGNDLGGIETAFVKIAKSYGRRKGLSYAAWREVGVSAEVLTKAGITRST